MATARTSPPTGIIAAEGFKSYTAFGSDIELADGGVGTAAVTGLPGYKHCPGGLLITTAAGAATLVVQDHSGNAAVLTLPSSIVLYINASVQKIVASGTANIASVTAFWWASDRV